MVVLWSHHQKKLYINRVDNDEFIDDWEDYTNYEIINIFGHCKFDEVLIGDNYFGIVPACAYGNKLTAIELRTHKIYQQVVVTVDIE
jgi:serine/threonine protein phosphatase 1